MREINNSRIGWIDNLKGIAILLVVIRHVMQANILDCSETVIGNAIFAVQMPLFMAIAGFFSITSDKYYQNAEALKAYVKKRAIHYMLPFFSWFVVVYVLIRGFYDRNLVKATSTLINNVDVGLWFLYVVFMLSVISIIANAICRRLNLPLKTGITPIIVGGGLLLPLLVVGRLFGMRFLGINLLLYYYLFFAAGRFLFCNQKLIKRCFNSHFALYGTGLLSAAIYILIVLNHNIELAPDGIENICLRILAAVAGCTAIAIEVYIFSRGRTNKLLEILGQNTLEVYVVHVHYIGLLSKGTHYLYTVDGLIVLLVALLITALMSFVTILVMKKIPALNFIFFGKQQSER